MKDYSSAEKERIKRKGLAKVTGAATYTADYQLPNLAYGVLVGSTIASGRISALHSQEALAVDGVIDVLSYWNKPSVPAFEDKERLADIWFPFPVFYTDEIQQNDQYIALVVAESLEIAQYAASLLHADYIENEPIVDFKQERLRIPLKERGQARGDASTWQKVSHVVDEEYTIAMEVHNPMEMHATIAHWLSEQRLDIYEKSQNVKAVQDFVASIFDLEVEQVHVTAPFVGGGFGSGLRTWPHAIATIMAAKHVKRPVKVMLSRPQMFTQVGFRPQSWQRLKIGANSEGRLLAAQHQAKAATSLVEQANPDNITGIIRKVYHFEHLVTEQSTVPLNIPVPTWMRGPGDSTGSFAVESAIDQLAYSLNMDAVQLRLQNIAPHDLETGKPWSSHYLAECIARGAKQVNWANRPKKVKQWKEGKWHIGLGHAVGLWNAMRRKASASAELLPNGRLFIRSAMTDIGTGTAQAMRNIAHEHTGLAKEQIFIEIGDSDLPFAPSQGGSWGMASLSAAVVEACKDLKKQIATYFLEFAEGSISEDKLKLSRTGIAIDGLPNKEVPYDAFFRRNKLARLFTEQSAAPGMERDNYGFVSSAAHFCQLRVHSITGQIKVDRYVCVVDAGTILNEEGASNQIFGAVAGGIGMALLEEQIIDTSSGRLLANDLAGYHVSVNSTVPIIEVTFINKPDPHINPSGAKGLGEVGLIGNAAAVANAIYHATGIRFRDLPITPDKVIRAMRANG